jgi:hypothetical protein
VGDPARADLNARDAAILDYAEELAALSAPNSQTGTTYTLVLADRVVELSNASAIALTVPTNASVAFIVGTVIEIVQMGAGVVTISGSGVTFRSRGSLLSTAGQYAVASIRKRATNEWVVTGDIA